MKKEELNPATEQHKTKVGAPWIGMGVVVVLVGLVLLMRRRRKAKIELFMIYGCRFYSNLQP